MQGSILHVYGGLPKRPVAQTYLAPGKPVLLGDDLTTEGLDFSQLRTGMRLRAGGAVIELTRQESSGFYASVVQPGWVRSNDIIVVLDIAV